MTANSVTNLSSQQLRRAAAIQEKIEALQAQLAAISGATAPADAPAPRKKGTMSAAGRERIAAAQRARWAKVKSAKAGKAKR